MDEIYKNNLPLKLFHDKIITKLMLIPYFNVIDIDIINIIKYQLYNLSIIRSLNLLNVNLYIDNDECIYNVTNYINDEGVSFSIYILKQNKVGCMTQITNSYIQYHNDNSMIVVDLKESHITSLIYEKLNPYYSGTYSIMYNHHMCILGY